MEVWARFFREVLIVSPCSDDSPKADAIRYVSENIKFLSLGAPTYTSGIAGKFRLFASSFRWLLKANRIIRSTDIIMARGPDSVGFLGYLLSRGRTNLRFAKYADQWQSFAGESFGYRLQKMSYRSAGFGGPVLIYGTKDPHRPHLIPFFPSAVSRSEWESAGHRIKERVWQPPYKLIFVGRLVPAKGADTLLKAVKILRERGTEFRLDLVGDGPEKANLMEMATELGIANTINFHGWVSWQELENLYANANCFVHCSRKEGFGKVILEAMSFALPLVGTDVGVSRVLIAPPSCGFIVAPGQPEALADTIGSAFMDIDALQAAGNRGREKVIPYLLDNQELLYRSFIEKHLGLRCD
ncbi:MAG: glycosyltransferase [Desulfobulbaceae bacterium]|nr:glycosyltransferase [Desulfobulbaceae bacterium]